MTPTVNILIALTEAGITLRQGKDKLLASPSAAVTLATRAVLEGAKPALLRLFRHPPPARPAPEEWGPIPTPTWEGEYGWEHALWRERWHVAPPLSRPVIRALLLEPAPTNLREWLGLGARWAEVEAALGEAGFLPVLGLKETTEVAA